MLLGDLQTKDVVLLNDGKNIGRIVDVEIDNDGRIVNIIVEKKRLFKRLFHQANQYNIMFSEISKIGDDVILINI